MDPVGNIINWHLILRPAGIAGLKDPLAHLGMKPAHSINKAAPAKSEKSDVKGATVILFGLQSHYNQIIRKEALSVCIMLCIFFQKISIKSIETRLHRGMSGEYISRPGGPESLQE